MGSIHGPALQSHLLKGRHTSHAGELAVHSISADHRLQGSSAQIGSIA